MDSIDIANKKVEVREFKTDSSERDRYGLSVYMFTATCDMWEYYMPAGTIRDKAYRDVSGLWGAFFRDNKDRLNEFVRKLSSATGYNLHVANKYSMPSSVYQRFAMFNRHFYGDGKGDCAVELIFYANNR